jgi:3-oxoacyl-[acyl-carrier protein] reductase
MKILITGGNGDIAQATAKRLRERGHNVLTPGRDLLDVTNETNVSTHLSFYKPDVIINNAGYISPGEVVLSNSPNWQHQVEVNLIGTYLCSKYALQAGAKQVINIGSSAGAKGKNGWSAYCAAKAGVERLTESLYAEGINATCLRIGRTATKMRRSLYGEEDPRTLLHPDDIAKWIEEIIDYPTVYAGAILEITVENKLAFLEWKEAHHYGNCCC